MKKIFINGLNAKSGGGKSIFVNYLSILMNKTDVNEKYFVLAPQKEEYLKYENANIKIVSISKFYNKHLLLPIAYKFIIPKLLQKLRIDKVFNLADIPIATKIEQIFLFDWPYAVYPESQVWKKMDIYSFIFKKIKLFQFKKNIKYINKVIAQNQAMKYRLEKIFSIKDISIVPNAVALDNLNGGEYVDYNFPNGKKLLYLTHYYPHKNLEIFIPLAEIIKEKKLNYKLIITIDKEQHSKAQKLLNTIKTKRLDDIIINIGSVHMKHVPELYKQTDGLLMPTLLESFSGTYVEAMYHKKPIFTSNFDFAQDVCKDAAFYFNPFSAENILENVEFAFKNDAYLSKIENGEQRLKELYTWQQTFDLYQKLILA